MCHRESDTTFTHSQISVIYSLNEYIMKYIISDQAFSQDSSWIIVTEK